MHRNVWTRSSSETTLNDLNEVLKMTLEGLQFEGNPSSGLIRSSSTGHLFESAIEENFKIIRDAIRNVANKTSEKHKYKNYRASPNYYGKYQQTQNSRAHLHVPNLSYYNAPSYIKCSNPEKYSHLQDIQFYNPPTPSQYNRDICPDCGYRHQEQSYGQNSLSSQQLSSIVNETRTYTPQHEPFLHNYMQKSSYSPSIFSERGIYSSRQQKSLLRNDFCRRLLEFLKKNFELIPPMESKEAQTHTNVDCIACQTSTMNIPKKSTPTKLPYKTAKLEKLRSAKQVPGQANTFRRLKSGQEKPPSFPATIVKDAQSQTMSKLKLKPRTLSKGTSTTTSSFMKSKQSMTSDSLLQIEKKPINSKNNKLHPVKFENEAYSQTSDMNNLNNWLSGFSTVEDLTNNENTVSFEFYQTGYETPIEEDRYESPFQCDNLCAIMITEFKKICQQISNSSDRQLCELVFNDIQNTCQPICETLAQNTVEAQVDPAEILKQLSRKMYEKDKLQRKADRSMRKSRMTKPDEKQKTWLLDTISPNRKSQNAKSQTPVRKRRNVSKYTKFDESDSDIPTEYKFGSQPKESDEPFEETDEPFATSIRKTHTRSSQEMKSQENSKTASLLATQESNSKIDKNKQFDKNVSDTPAQFSFGPAPQELDEELGASFSHTFSKPQLKQERIQEGSKTGSQSVPQRRSSEIDENKKFHENDSNTPIQYKYGPPPKRSDESLKKSDNVNKSRSQLLKDRTSQEGSKIGSSSAVQRKRNSEIDQRRKFGGIPSIKQRFNSLSSVPYESFKGTTKSYDVPKNKKFDDAISDTPSQYKIGLPPADSYDSFDETDQSNFRVSSIRQADIGSSETLRRTDDRQNLYKQIILEPGWKWLESETETQYESQSDYKQFNQRDIAASPWRPYRVGSEIDQREKIGRKETSCNEICQNYSDIDSGRNIYLDSLKCMDEQESDKNNESSEFWKSVKCVNECLEKLEKSPISQGRFNRSNRIGECELTNNTDRGLLGHTTISTENINEFQNRDMKPYDNNSKRYSPNRRIPDYCLQPILEPIPEDSNEIGPPPTEEAPKSKWFWIDFNPDQNQKSDIQNLASTTSQRKTQESQNISQSNFENNIRTNRNNSNFSLNDTRKFQLTQRDSFNKNQNKGPFNKDSSSTIKSSQSFSNSERYISFNANFDAARDNQSARKKYIRKNNPRNDNN